MKINIDPSWEKIVLEEFRKNYFQELLHFVEKEYRENNCYPAEEVVFSAFEYCPFDQVKVVILGQDPYHGKGQAHGLCFSVLEEAKTPPSLRNIFKEIQTDLGNTIPDNGNLERWAKQGVLLLNATMTVRESEAGSHQKKGWERFTDAIIERISEEREDVVFLLWGGPAKKKAKKIDSEKHLILTSGHPSPLSANRGYWFGNKHFSQTNEFLLNKGKSIVEW